MTSATVSAALAMSGLVPFEAKLLLAHVIDRDRAWLAAHGDAQLTRHQALAFDAQEHLHAALSHMACKPCTVGAGTLNPSAAEPPQ